jgi:hypothetical protein
MYAEPIMQPTEPPAPRPWVTPETECYETRPEVTAYAGDSGPWNNR